MKTLSASEVWREMDFDWNAPVSLSEQIAQQFVPSHGVQKCFCAFRFCVAAHTVCVAQVTTMASSCWRLVLREPNGVLWRPMRMICDRAACFASHRRLS